MAYSYHLSHHDIERHSVIFVDEDVVTPILGRICLVSIRDPACIRGNTEAALQS